MPNDDLYTVDGEAFTNGVYYPDTPSEIKEEAQQKQGIIASSYPVMDDVADWFKEQIENVNTVSYVKSYAEIEKVPLETAMRAFDVVRVLLESKAMEFAEFGKEAGNGK